MVPSTATLDVDQTTVWHLSVLLNAEHQRRGTRTGTRALTCCKQAVLILRWFRDDTAIDALAGDNHLSRATGYRYIDEGVDVLTDQAPDLHQVLEQARLSPEDPLILDGKLFPSDRCSEPAPPVLHPQSAKASCALSPPVEQAEPATAAGDATTWAASS